MKKIFALALAALCLLLSSCGNGASVSYMQVRNANDPVALLAHKDTSSYIEKITCYADGEEVYYYSIYIEPTDDVYAPYNVIESTNDYGLYAFDGEIYVKQRSDIYAILQASGTYSEFVGKYITAEIPLDSGVFYQLRSETTDIGIKVAYYSDLLPDAAAKYSSLGACLGDTVVVEYDLLPDYRARSITYYLRKGGDPSSESLLMTRVFEYEVGISDRFSFLPTLDDPVHVSVVYLSGTENEHVQTFTVPAECLIGIDTAGKPADFYLDPEFTVPFGGSPVQAEEGLRIYAKFE